MAKPRPRTAGPSLPARERTAFEARLTAERVSARELAGAVRKLAATAREAAKVIAEQCGYDSGWVENDDTDSSWRSRQRRLALKVALLESVAKADAAAKKWSERRDRR